MTEALPLQQEIEIQNHAFTQYHEMLRVADHAPWYKQVFEDQFGVDGLEGAQLEERMDKRRARMEHLKRTELVLAEIGKKVEEITESGTKSVSFTPDVALQLFDDAIDVVNTKDTRFKGLYDHLNQVSAAVSGLNKSDAALSRRHGITPILDGEHQTLFQMFADKHDIEKWVSSAAGQYEIDHPYLLAYAIDTYFPKLGVDEKATEFLAFLARHHENVYEEDEHENWINSQDPKERACALFLLADTLTKSIDFDKLAIGELVLDEESVLARFGDIVKRYNDKITSSNIWFDWAAKTVTTYVETFKFLETKYDVKVSNTMLSRLVDTVLVEFTKLRIQDDARENDAESIKKILQYNPNLPYKPFPTFSKEQKIQLITIISELGEYKTRLLQGDLDRTVEGYTQAIVGILNTFVDPHGMGEELAKNCSHETWRIVRNKFEEEHAWKMQGETGVGNNFANVYLAGNELYEALRDPDNREPLRAEITKWTDDVRSVDTRLSDGSYPQLQQLMSTIAVSMHNSYAFSHEQTKTFAEADIHDIYASYIGAVSIVNGLIHAIRGEKDLVKSITAAEVEGLKNLSLSLPIDRQQLSQQLNKKAEEKYTVKVSDVANDFANRRKSAFEQVQSNPLKLTFSESKFVDQKEPLNIIIARIMHEEWLQTKASNTHNKTVIAPLKPQTDEERMLLLRRFTDADGNTYDAKLVPFEDLAVFAQLQNAAAIDTVFRWITSDVLETANEHAQPPIADSIQKIEDMIRFLGAPGGLYDGSNPIVEKGSSVVHFKFIAVALQNLGVDSYRLDAKRQHQLQVYARLPALGDEGVTKPEDDLKSYDRKVLLVGLCAALITLRDNMMDGQVTISPEVEKIATDLGLGFAF